jgi:hypothetical protein
MGMPAKEVQMTFRVETDLRAQFTQATEADHRPAAQVLREFMRYYVQQHQERTATPQVTQVISAAERQRREAAAHFARASVGLEGLNITEAYTAEVQCFINGEIEFAELTKVVHEQAGRPRR